jgi:hypothetical protein
MNIDHHLQLSLLRKLSQSDTPVRYSDLKDGDIENSLFSYHLNKLIDRKMVEKIDDGYRLTTDGSRWLNDNGVFLPTRQKEALRVSIALVVTNEAGEFLIGQRTGQFKSMINDYMLPTRYYENTADITDQIDDTIAIYIPTDSLLERVDYGFGQIKAVYEDKTMRHLFCITHCMTKNYEPLVQDWPAEFTWMSLDEITAIDHPSARILRGIISYVRSGDNHHETPLFAS